MLKVYGRANSINVRKVLWMLDEVGVKYEREDWGRGYPVDGRSRIPQDQSGRRGARHRRRRFPAAGEQHHRALPRRQARPRRSLSQGPEGARDHRILDGLGLDRFRQRHAAGVSRPRRQEPGIRRQGRERRRGMGRADGACSSSTSPAKAPTSWAASFTIGDIPVGLVVNRWFSIDFQEARVQGRLGLLRPACRAARATRRTAATARLELSPRIQELPHFERNPAMVRRGDGMCMARIAHPIGAVAWLSLTCLQARAGRGAGILRRPAPGPMRSTAASSRAPGRAAASRCRCCASRPWPRKAATHLQREGRHRFRLRRGGQARALGRLNEPAQPAAAAPQAARDGGSSRRPPARSPQRHRGRCDDMARGAASKRCSSLPSAPTRRRTSR